MTGQPAHDTLHRTPFWQVQCVFDPDGTGKDFAYTIGLHTKGLPELHVWGRPSLGEDPGHDWMLSTRDRCQLLNELGQLLVDGRLGVGTELTREYDDGMAAVTYRVDPPGDKEQLEAYGVPPGVDVLPIPWSLQRAPEGPLTGLAPEAERAARSTYSSLLGGLDPSRRAPKGWALPDVPSFDADQRFGPLTPVVLARAAELWQADEETWVELLHAAVTVEYATSLRWPATLAIAVARPSGRRQCLEAVQRESHDLVERLTEQPAAQRRWRSVVRQFHAEGWQQLSPQERKHLQHNLTHAFHNVVTSCLMAEAVADLADEALLLHARGPWLSGIRGEAVLSDPAWRAAPEVLGAVRRLLARSTRRLSASSRGSTTSRART